MKFDNYCVALLVLLLFFIYIDNINNIEGYADLVIDSPVAPVEPGPSPVVGGVKQDYVGIGMKPQKLDGMKPTASLAGDFKIVTSSGDQLASLDQAFGPLLGAQVVPNQVPADLKSLGSRVGGPGNVGDPALGGMGGPAVSSGVGAALGGTTVPSPQGSKKVELHMAFAPWCGWSKKALPDFDKIMSEYDGTQVGSYAVSVMKHDSETPEGKAFAKENGVKGFPTIFFKVDGKRVDAKGRSYDELTSQLKEICA